MKNLWVLTPPRATRLDGRGALSNHASVRASVLLSIVSLLTLACGDPPAKPESGRGSAPADAPEPTVVEAPSLEATPLEATEPKPTAPEPAAVEPAPKQPELVSPDSPSKLAEPSAPDIDHSKAPTPTQPSGPKPGSPEADAELAELLEESTLTQEEFDEAFRERAPQIPGEGRFDLEPSERPR